MHLIDLEQVMKKGPGLVPFWSTIDNNSIQIITNACEKNMILIPKGYQNRAKFDANTY